VTVRVQRLSPAGRGAVAVLAVEGPGALALVAGLSGGRPLPLGRPVLRKLVQGELEIEEALVLAEGPERVELHLHGSPAVVARVVRALSPAALQESAGASLEERAAAALASAESEDAARILLDQAEGALRRELAAIAGIDHDARQVERLAALAALGRALAPVIAPPSVVLAGAVNAGKSTLFNALAGKRRVVTSGEPGTTRDPVRERVRAGALVFDRADTAGERPPPSGAAGELESRGQGLGRELAAAADLVLWLIPARDLLGSLRPGPVAGARPPRVVLASQAAGIAPAERSPWHVAALEEPAAAAGVVERAVREALEIPREPWVSARAVPFDGELVALLEHLARAAPSARRAGLAQLLARPAPGS
jgi:tRNA modification GTPase